MNDYVKKNYTSSKSLNLFLITQYFIVQKGKEIIWIKKMMLLNSSEQFILENFPDDFSVHVPAVNFETLQKSELEEKINKTLEEATIGWFTDEIIEHCIDSMAPTVYCHTKNYLSVGQSYGELEDYITIDMKTGERVFLNDILDVDKLCDFLLENEQYTTARSYLVDQQEADENIREEVKYGVNLKDVLEQCSMKQDEFYNWYCESEKGKYPSLWQRANFYLQETQLVILLGGEWNNEVVIKYKDLDGILNEDFKNRMMQYL